MEKKLAEIRRQTWFERAEFIFIETASPERERELFAPFCEQHPNCRLLATDDRKTLYGAWNLGWTAARAPLLCYSNMDDTMHPRLLESVVAAMQQHSWDACSVLIALQAMDEHWNDWSPRRLQRLTLSSRPGPFTAWRAELKETIGMFDEQFMSAGDKDFWSRLVDKKQKLGLINKVLYLYTMSPQQISKSDAGRERRLQDQRLLAAKPYSIRWSGAMRRRIFWLRLLFRLHPGCFTVAP